MDYMLLLMNLGIALVMAVQANFYFNCVLGKENNKPNKWIYFIAFIIIAIIYFNIYFSSSWSSLLAFVLIFSLSMSYEVGFRLKIMYSVLYIVLLTLVNTFCLFLLDPSVSLETGESTIDLASGQRLMALSLLISCTVMFAVIQVIGFIARRRSYTLQFRYLLLFISVPLISVYQMNVLTMYSEKNIHYFLSVSGFIVLNILVVYILDTVIARIQLQHENAQLQLQMDYQDANYEKTVHSFKKIKSIIHDTNQQFLYVNACIERGKIDEASDHIRQTLNMIEHAYHRVNTGNLAIDALVTNALNIGQDNGIRMDTELRLYDRELGIDRYDLCVVLGNLLDNAIEASKKVKVAADRYIRVYIHSNSSALFIRIYNVVDQPVVTLQSNKSNADYHGFGLTNIKRICDKYGGHMTIETEAKGFNNMVVLPFPKKESRQ